VADGVLILETLGSNHLFDLVPDRLAVLEQQREVFADREPAAFLSPR
jgi:hypothetical protein